MSLNSNNENEHSEDSLTKKAGLWLNSLGYSEKTETFKSFGENNPDMPERFCIERRLSPRGQDVVIKLASISDAHSVESLSKETANLKFLNDVFGKVKASINGIHYKMPKLTGQIKGSTFTGIETEYCENDNKLRDELTSNARYQILKGVLQCLQDIEPSESIEKDATTRRYPKVIQRLREKGLISGEQTVQAREIIMTIIPREQLLVPECIVHGDIHGQNIQINNSEKPGSVECTIMDVESMKRGSPYIDMAILYTRGEIANRLGKAQDGTLPKLLENFWVYDLGEQTEDLKKTAVDLFKEDSEVSEAMFRAHVMFRTMADLEYNSDLSQNYPVYKDAVRIENELIQEQLDWFEEHQSVISVFKMPVQIKQ